MSGAFTSCCLGDMWAGSNGMKCKQCHKRTFVLFLTDEEVEAIRQMPHADRMIEICIKKMGQPLCEDHQPTELKLPPWWYDATVDTESTGKGE